MNAVLQHLGSRLARFLTRPRESYEKFSVLSREQLDTSLQPGDLLLVEGNSRVSTAIKYLTQSTWSHVCMYVGAQEDEPACIVEADLVDGVVRSPLSKYVGFNLRICRPFNLSEQDRQATVRFVLDRVGYQYDTRNIIDLMRYLLPTPPVPSRYRRQLLALGSGDPTRAICSTLIAQAFQSVKYPILPQHLQVCLGTVPGHCDDVLLESRHFSHFTPRDFDLSPYFEIVKPTIRGNFDYRKILWLEESANK
ncbi:MAG: YiiX/YebB-like N1pC/P60 family cysteine hydrolase [Halioglobus sp.]